MTNAVDQVQPPLKFIPPRFSPWIRRWVKWLLPLWLRWRTDIVRIDTIHEQTLTQQYADFLAGKSRFLIAFRHPAPEDGYGLAYLLWFVTARSLAANRHALVHAHFLYDRGIPLWAGRWVGWLYSRLGGISIQRGRLDMAALKLARQLLVQGDFPMVAAPEGGNNGHNEIVSPLEPGIAQLAFWGVEDLARLGRSEALYILPVGIQYHYITPPWQAIADLMGQLETRCGLTQALDSQENDLLPLAGMPPQATHLYRRLYRLAEHLLGLMETYYKDVYGAGDPDLSSELGPRLQRLLDQALTVAEQYFQLKPKGAVIDRCRRLEQAGWDRIFRQDIQSRDAISPVERGLADRAAEEANLRMWHMRLVENFVAVTGRYVLEQPTADRFADTVLLLADTVVLLQGGNPFPRQRLGAREMRLTVGEPICVTERLADYRQSRRQAVTALTKRLQLALEELIVDSAQL